jgi:hypothetical protein
MLSSGSPSDWEPPRPGSCHTCQKDPPVRRSNVRGVPVWTKPEENVSTPGIGMNPFDLVSVSLPAPHQHPAGTIECLVHDSMNAQSRYMHSNVR